MAEIIRMRRDLGAPITAPVWPAGLLLAEFENGDAREIHALMDLAYINGGGSVDTFDHWWADLLIDPEFDKRFCVVIKDDTSRIVGYTQCWTSSFIKDVVVHPDTRRQGLAEAMLSHAFGLFKSLGKDYIDLKVLGDNDNAIRLYKKLGFFHVTEDLVGTGGIVPVGATPTERS